MNLLAAVQRYHEMRNYPTKQEKLWKLLDENALVFFNLFSHCVVEYKDIVKAYHKKYEEPISEASISRVVTQWEEHHDGS